MKKILLVNASPRKGGNSDIVTQTLAKNLTGCEVTIFNMREKNCKPCIACGVCQKKETQICVQNDDIKELLSLLNECDSIVLTTPIYNQQITSQAKLFIERWYPFFNVEHKLMSNTTKYGKKGAMICCFWGSPIEVITKYADWTLEGFSQIGVEDTKALIFPHIPEKGDILKKEEYLQQLHELAVWLAE